LDPLMLCIAAGFVIRNFTTRGRDLVRGIESVSPLVFAVFFTLAGADLNLVALRQMWIIASILVAARLGAVWTSTWLGSRLVENEPGTRRWAWTGFISQAGVTLVLVSLVAVHFTEWGNAFKTLIVATIAVNQIIGPIAFKIGLVRVGEVGCQEIPIKPGSVPLRARASGGPSLEPASD
jgi:Kef-type K+ transport system membrane component KefB